MVFIFSQDFNSFEIFTRLDIGELLVVHSPDEAPTTDVCDPLLNHLS